MAADTAELVDRVAADTAELVDKVAADRAVPVGRVAAAGEPADKDSERRKPQFCYQKQID